MNPASLALVDHHLAEVRKHVELDAQQRRAPGGLGLGMSRRDVEKYSVARVILASAHGRLPTEAPFEREASIAEAKARGLPEPLGSNSFYIPREVLDRALDASGSSGSGSNYLIGSTTAPGGIIGATLQAQSVVLRLGVRRVPNMTGDVSIPVAETPPDPTWIATDGVSQISATQPVFTNRVAAPKSVAALTPISHQMLTQAPQLVEPFALTEIARSIARAVDDAFLQGTGNSGQPLGITGMSNVGTVTGTSIAYAGLLEFQSDVLDSNALGSPQGFAYVTTPAIAKLLAGRQRFTGTDSPLWQGSLIEGQCAGARAVSTISAPASTIIAGDFTQAIMFEWPGILFAADPFTGFSTGVLTLRAMLLMDFVLLRPQSFSIATSVT